MIKILIAIAVLLRLVGLSTSPPELNWDEVSQGYTAYSLAQTGQDEWGEKTPLFFRSYGEWKSAVYIYLIVPFIKVLGLNAWSVRLPSAIAGIVSIYLVYLIAGKLYSKKTGLWAAFIMAVTPWTFALGRPGFEANVALALILAGTYFFIKSTEKNSPYSILHTLYSAILFGLAMHTYNSAKVFVPLFALYCALSTKLYKKPKEVIVFFTVLLVFTIPILVNLRTGYSQARFAQVGVATDLKGLNEFVGQRHTFFLGELGNKLVFNKYTYSLYKTVDNGLSYLDPSFLFVSGGPHHQHSVPYRGVLYLSQLALILIGIGRIGREKGFAKTLPWALILLGVLPAALTRDSGHVLRSLFSAPGFIILSAIGMVALTEKKLPQLKLLYLFLALEIVSYLLMYFLWYPKAYSRDWQRGHQEVALYLREHESEYKKIVMTKWFGEPQLFLAFYNAWDPRAYIEANKSLIRYEEEGKLWLDQLEEYVLGKYHFKYLNWEGESQAKDTLYIGKFDDFPEGVDIKKIIAYPDGQIAFIIVAGGKE